MAKYKFISIPWLIGTLAIGVLIWGIILFSLKHYNPFSSEDFEKTTWFRYENTVNQTRNNRGPMAGDVRDKLMAGNFKRNDVVNILGNPDKEYEDGSIEYYLGYWSGFQIDMDGLWVSFHNDGKVKNVSIRQH
ncbi:MAG: hypothetical protein WC899_08520 [bacterium]|jgi:hypothetical protein